MPLKTTYPVSASKSYVDSNKHVISRAQYQVTRTFEFEREVKGALHDRTRTELNLEPELNRLVAENKGDAITQFKLEGFEYATLAQTLAAASGDADGFAESGRPMVEQLRRAGGERGAQVAAITGLSTRTTTSVSDQIFFGLDNEEATTTQMAMFRVQFWRCPSLRLTPIKGELVWSRNGGTSSGALQLFQDGHWVAKADDTTRLRQLVATSPLAVEFVDAAESAQSAGSTKLYIGIGLLLLSLVSEGVAVVGAVQKDYLVAAGGLGGGIVLLSVGLPIASSGMTSEGVATTNAMNAVDAYNEQLRRRNDFFGE